MIEIGGFIYLRLGKVVNLRWELTPIIWWPEVIRVFFPDWTPFHLRLQFRSGSQHWSSNWVSHLITKHLPHLQRSSPTYIHLRLDI